ncbi:TIR domain-containing protein [Desulfovibrio cuneatus]|uniref:TIR domain-containing protein n=1 Tax=Desulfovibrio cuneatus TaxID=159728 RepID=UPI000422855F|nr:TIR domain-containing protein [Desulfovibrio cuneatus]
MKIFISWSGELSREVAEVFRSWLPSVIQTLKPYVSSEDIQKGVNWSTNIACELDSSSFGIICLTKANVSAPWVNFEAGALSKCFTNAKVSPFLFRINQSDVQGPLTQFQSTKFDEKDILKLLTSINDACGERKLDSQILEECFAVWWPKLKEKLNGIKTDSEHEVLNVNSQGEQETDHILEEVLDTVRTSLRILNEPERLLPKEYMALLLSNTDFPNGSLQKRYIPRNHPAIKDLHISYQRLRSFLNDTLKDTKATSIADLAEITCRIDQEELFLPWAEEVIRLTDSLGRPIRFLRREFDE